MPYIRHPSIRPEHHATCSYDMARIALHASWAPPLTISVPCIFTLQCESNGYPCCSMCPMRITLTMRVPRIFLLGHGPHAYHFYNMLLIDIPLVIYAHCKPPSPRAYISLARPSYNMCSMGTPGISFAICFPCAPLSHYVSHGHYSHRRSQTLLSRRL